MTEAQGSLIVAEPAPLPAVSESAALLQVIERMAVNPAVDVEKFERLMAMHERIQAKRAEQAFNADLADMQHKLPTINERGGITNNAGKVQSKYALWEDVVEAITPVLGAHGFSLSYRLGRDGERQTVTGILRHRAGHKEETTLSLPLDMSGSKNAVQGVGSTVSYGKRYVTQALLNLVSSGEDDDGQGGSDDLISAEQKAELVELLQAQGAVDPNGAGTQKFLKYMAVASLDEIKAANFGRAKAALEAKKSKAS